MKLTPRPLMVIPDLSIVGGAERQCLRLTAEFRHRGIDAEVVTWDSGAPRLLDGHSRSELGDVRTYRSRLDAMLRKAPRVRESPAMFAFRRLSRRRLAAAAARTIGHGATPGSIVHLHGFFSAIAAQGAADAARTHRMPLIVKVANDIKDTQARLNAAPVLRRVLEQADALVSLTPAMRPPLQRLFPKARIEVIPNGIALPERHGHTPHGPMLYVGTFKHQKGIDVLLRAIAMTEEVELWLAGDGALRGDMQSLAEELKLGDRVRFLGTRSDVPDLILQARAFVLPSRWEGLPNALLEAMSAALPSVVTDIAGSGELVDATTGWKVPPEDPAALANALSAAWASPELPQRGRAARNVIERHYSIAATADAYQALYEDLLSSRPR